MVLLAYCRQFVVFHVLGVFVVVLVDFAVLLVVDVAVGGLVVIFFASCWFVLLSNYCKRFAHPAEATQRLGRP